MDVLVIGGTGTVGSEVVENLVGRGVEPTVLTRSPDEAREAGPDAADYVHGDLSEPNTLGSAFDGQDKLYLLTPVHPNEAALGIAAIEAAERKGLQHVVYHSIHDVEVDPEPLYHEAKIRVTARLRESDIAATLIRPNNYFQNDLRFRQAILQRGLYPQPIGRVGLNRVDVRDIAEASVTALLESGHEGRVYPVVGPDTLTGPDVAELYSRHLSHEVEYVGDDLDVWSDRYGAALPDWIVSDFRRNYEHFQQHGLRASEEELDHQREILGREPRSFESFVTEIVDEWTGGASS